VKPAHRIVEVLWDDAFQEAAQQTIEELASDQYVCTVGYVVRETERSVWIAAEVLDGGDVRGSTRIPRGMIVEIRELRRAAKSRARIGDTK
jgi:hypothetical protein